MHCWMHCWMQPWVAIWWPWLVETWAALPLEKVCPSCPHVGVENSVAWAVQLMALAVELEVADESVAWAAGALSAKVAMVAIQARVGVDRLSALVAIQARVGVERLRAWWPCILHWSSHPIRHHQVQ